MRPSSVFSDVCDLVARDLPEGWELHIGLARNSGDVQLIDPDGEEVEFPSNRETLEQAVFDALEHAIDDDSLPRAPMENEQP